MFLSLMSVICVHFSSALIILNTNIKKNRKLYKTEKSYICHHSSANVCLSRAGLTDNMYAILENIFIRCLMSTKVCRLTSTKLTYAYVVVCIRTNK